METSPCAQPLREYQIKPLEWLLRQASIPMTSGAQLQQRFDLDRWQAVSEGTDFEQLTVERQGRFPKKRLESCALM